MQIGRIVGAVLGFIMLALIFVLPFSNIIDSTKPPDTLFNILRFFINTPGGGQSVELSSLLYTAFIYQIAAILLIAASFVGLYPLGSGVLGTIGMGFVTFGPYVVFNRNSSNFGSAFYLLWLLSLVQLVLAIGMLRWERRSRRRREAAADMVESFGNKTSEPEANRRMMDSALGTTTQAQPSVGRYCQNCGTLNSAHAMTCVKCASPL